MCNHLIFFCKKYTVELQSIVHFHPHKKSYLVVRCKRFSFTNKCASRVGSGMRYLRMH